MKPVKIFLFFLFIAISGRAQTINPEQFNKMIFNSSFNSSRDVDIWPVTNTQESVYLIQNEEYSLKRKSLQKGDYLFPTIHNVYPGHEIQASLKLIQNGNNEQTAGICFNFNQSCNSGYILEINNKKCFRVKKLNSDGTIKYFTGSGTKSNWILFKMLTNDGTENDIDILVLNGLTEIYLNRYYAFSFSDSIQGPFHNFGLYVSPASESVFKYIHLLIPLQDISKYNESTILASQKTDTISTDTVKPVGTQNVTTGQVTTAEAKKYLDMILNLKNDLTKKEKEISTTKTMLSKCREDNLILKDFISKNIDNQMNTRLLALEKEIIELKATNEKLVTENKTLLEFKTYYTTSEKDKDIVNFLYEEIRKLQNSNLALTKKVDSLQKELKKYRGY